MFKSVRFSFNNNLHKNISKSLRWKWNVYWERELEIYYFYILTWYTMKTAEQIIIYFTKCITNKIQQIVPLCNRDFILLTTKYFQMQSTLAIFNMLPYNGFKLLK